jgi:hypothetical protein
VILCEGDTLWIDPTWLARAEESVRKPQLVADLAEREKAVIEQVAPAEISAEGRNSSVTSGC